MRERAGLWEDSTFYNSYIMEELTDFRRQKWKSLLLSHFDSGKKSRVLDIGTGPGFFPCILAEEGHKVTGIDSSESMLLAARKNTAHLKPGTEFLSMDVESLEFENEEFDIVTGRNIIWVLDDPILAYREIYRVLRPGGKMLIYDANWNLQFFDEELLGRVRRHEEEHYEKTGVRLQVRTDDKRYYLGKPLANVLRPGWDEEVLKNVGFRRVQCRLDVGSLVYQEWEKKLYQETPLFEICAVK